mmetsp:Transcript_7307/g.14517  ORF Transcript_7307/g.14517 Transcript_7307/m.14517 type:complete len:296 (+) Transcript_7307:87-974(+)|eukprot:CAMPEP_0181318098 /NCGR_PEP_ID=MMETSP1101-20121128/16824_1 /TAXON_ID=46948 /ORGANISM="Rhodomonas abbreviata, Strain Caron Lab Isolate" /LENGTH=295 /DNA_ID=CAMNT_0023425543 /DNA_START=82 /DNA_END=969 /DNA_ORIENTATION=-
MKIVSILVLFVCFAVVVSANFSTDEGSKSEQNNSNSPKSIFDVHQRLRALVFNSVFSLQSVRHFTNLWKWTRSMFGFSEVPEMEQNPAILKKHRAPTTGLSKVFFGAMVAKSVLSWFISPLAAVFGQSGIIETAAMAVGLGQAYLTEHLKGFSELYAMYRSSNEELQDKVGEFQGENDQLKESNTRLEESNTRLEGALNQLELIRGHLQEMLMMGGGTAEGVEAAVNRIEKKTDETIEVLNSQKKSFEEQKESFERQSKVCEEERRTCERMKKVCEDEREYEEQEAHKMWIPLAN